MSFLYSALVSLILAVVLVRLLVGSRLFGSIVDIPNERSSHSAPTPRTGGLGIMAAALISWLLLAPGSYGAAIASAVSLSALSFIDDKHGLSAGLRLCVQALVSVVFLAFAYDGPGLLVPLALLALVWMCNLYNFMDGSDGLAGGMTVFGFGAYAIAADLGGAIPLSLLSAAFAGAAGGFLVWNFHKARIFMGDSGSVPLGFLAAAIGMLGWQQGTWPMWFPALVFSPFIADATVTLVRRYLRGERLSEAHRAHYYQRTLRMGLGHRGTALAAYALMLACAASALVAKDWHPAAVAALLAAWGLVYAGGMRLVDRRWAEFERKPQG